MNISKIILVVSLIPVFTAGIYAAIIYKSLRDELRAFAWFLFIGGILHLISLILWFNVLNNMPVLHVLVPATVLLLIRYYQIVMRGYLQPQILQITAIVFLLFSVLNSLFLQPIDSFNSYALTLESVLLIILSLATFLLLLNKTVSEEKLTTTKSVRWINSGIFIYHSSALLIFYFSNVLSSRYSDMFNIYTWIMHAFLSVVMYSCFIIALWNRPKN